MLKAVLLCFSTIGLLGQEAKAVQCLSEGSWPSFFNTEANEYVTEAYSIVYSDTLNALFMGGLIQSPETDGLVMRSDLDTGRVAWRKVIYCGSKGGCEVVSALSVNPSGTSLALAIANQD